MTGTDLFFFVVVVVFGAGAAYLWLRRRQEDLCRHLTQAAELEKALAEERLRQDEARRLESESRYERARQEVVDLRQRLETETRDRVAAETRCARITPLEEELAKSAATCERAAAENSTLRERMATIDTRLDEERKAAAERLILLQQAQEQMKVQFQNLAQQIFDDKSRRFAEANKEGISALLEPMRQQIGEFKDRVETIHGKEGQERASLLTEIKMLKDLNERVRHDAVQLTSALKGQVKTQGAWGEMILERVLEGSGLQKGREYETQTRLAGQEGESRRPDVIVHLPEGKDIVIDAKVSLTAYERFCSADDENERQKQMRLHLDSLRQHIRELSGRHYEGLAGLRSLEFVLLFVPVEGAFMAALDHDQSLFTDAFRQNIMLVSPSTLLATLKTVRHIWRFEDQNRNAEKIAQQATKLYDKFSGFIEAMEEIGTRLDRVRESYDTACQRLYTGRGNLIRQTDELRRLGVSVKKELPERVRALLETGEAPEDL